MIITLSCQVLKNLKTRNTGAADTQSQRVYMNINLEINGEAYQGIVFQTNDGTLISIPNIRSPNAAPFDELFQALSENKVNTGFLEVGEWDGSTYPFEVQVSLWLGPDGKVWAEIGDPDELPDNQEGASGNIN